MDIRKPPVIGILETFDVCFSYILLAVFLSTGQLCLFVESVTLA